MNGRRPDQVSLSAGLATIAVGVAFLLNELEAVEISGTLLAAMLAAAAGAILLISGLHDE